MAKKTEGKKLVAQNKDAHFRFFISETFEAGLVLLGTEVKALRTGKVALAESYIFVKNNEAFVTNLHISEYSHGNRENHEPGRTRKLLLNKKEILQLEVATHEQGMTIVPIQLYFKDGRAKLEIGVAKGKKLHDKRDTLKEKEAQREMDRVRKF